MPVTCMSACMVVLGVLLFLPAALIALVLRHRGRPRTAAFIMGMPFGIIVLSILSTVLVFVMMWLYGVRLSQNPARLFESTFGFAPPPGTEVFEAYAELGMDWEHRVMTFRAPKDVIDKICARKFALSDRKTCTGAYQNNAHNLPDRVQLWARPAVENADCFYLAKPFDHSFSTINEAILCYSEKTGVACFHWSGVD